jgi:serine phosphatase RsbU (regulator of sigma subunit)
VEPGSPAQNYATVALLIGPDERVRASSYPDRYPVSSSAAEMLPEDIALIRGALAGAPDGDVGENGAGRYAAIAHTVWSRDKEPLGVVYIQAPAGGPPDTNLLPELAAVIIPSSVAWLCLMLPIGLVFGVLTTRGLVRRVERLAGANARFRNGDTGIRVPVRHADEIGQLEQQFNQMAEQIVANFAQRQALAEQSVRREERARIDQEMQSAHYIQKALLPEESPDIPGWHIQTCYRPARDVGGDFYDFLSLPDEQIGIVIGDATGKGISSALIMATTCAMLRAAAPGSRSPGSVLALVNNLLLQNIPGGTFATCFYAILDPKSGRMRYANAGHNLPYLARDGEVHELRAVGMPLGLMPDQEYEEQELSISAADCILFYTDGLVEAHDPQGEMFGATRLQQWIGKRSKVDGLIETLYQDLLAFTGHEREQEDDITLVCLRKAA